MSRFPAIILDSDSQSVGPRQAVSASLENLLELQIAWDPSKIYWIMMSYSRVRNLCFN